MQEGKQYSESIEFSRPMDYLAMICKVDIEVKGDQISEKTDLKFKGQVVSPELGP